MLFCLMLHHDRQWVKGEVYQRDVRLTMETTGQLSTDMGEGGGGGGLNYMSLYTK